MTLGQILLVNIAMLCQHIVLPSLQDEEEEPLNRCDLAPDLQSTAQHGSGLLTSCVAICLQDEEDEPLNMRDLAADL
jgi:hypothetical protein